MNYVIMMNKDAIVCTISSEEYRVVKLGDELSKSATDRISFLEKSGKNFLKVNDKMYEIKVKVPPRCGDDDSFV